MKEIYTQIAENYGVSVAEVQRDMQTAIDEAYRNPSLAALAVPRQGDKPTLEEFIAHAMSKVSDEQNGL